MPPPTLVKEAGTCCAPLLPPVKDACVHLKVSHVQWSAAASFTNFLSGKTHIAPSGRLLISLFLCWNGSLFMLVHACGPEPSVFFQCIHFFDFIHFILFAISFVVV